MICTKLRLHLRCHVVISYDVLSINAILSLYRERKQSLTKAPPTCFVLRQKTLKIPAKIVNRYQIFIEIVKQQILDIRGD